MGSFSLKEYLLTLVMSGYWNLYLTLPSQNNMLWVVSQNQGNQNTPGSHSVHEGMGRLECEFVQPVTFLTLDPILDQNLQGNHLLQPQAFCLEVDVWLTCVF